MQYGQRAKEPKLKHSTWCKMAKETKGQTDLIEVVKIKWFLNCNRSLCSLATAFRCTAMWRSYRVVGRFEYNGGQVRATTVDDCQASQSQCSGGHISGVPQLPPQLPLSISQKSSPTSRGGPASSSERTFEEEGFASIPAKICGKPPCTPIRFRRLCSTVCTVR